MSSDTQKAEDKFHMKRVHIVGRQNNGKTMLIVELVKELKSRGIKTGTLKHSRHEHELDKPGKDSYFHRKAGGNPTAVITKNLMAVYLPCSDDESPLNQLEPIFSGNDLVIIEGYINGPGPKIEVWRKEIGTLPRILERDDVEAIITDDAIETDRPVLSRKDIKKIADYVCELAREVS